MLKHLITLIIKDRLADFDYSDNNKKLLLEDINKYNNNYIELMPLFTINNVYTTLTDLYCCFDDEIAKDLVGILWASFYNLQNKKNKNLLLDNVISDSNDSWTFIQCLNTFFKYFIPDNANKFSKWLLKISKFVNKDMAKDYFYTSLVNLVNFHFDFCLDVLNHYSLKNITEELICIYPLILGYLRKNNDSAVKEKDIILKRSKNEDCLKLYYKSFIVSLEPTVLNLKHLLLEIENNNFINTFELSSQIINNVCINNHRNNKLLEFIKTWIINNATNFNDSQAQYYILSTCECLLKSNLNIDELEFILLNFGTIKKDNLKIWHTLERILVKILNENKFLNILRVIIKTQGKNFINNIENMQYFINKFTESKKNKDFTILLFSDEILERNFIQILFSDENKSLLNFDKEILNDTNEIKIEICLREILLICLSGFRLGCFYCYLNPKLDFLNDDLKSFINYQIIYSSINYPKNCFEQIKAIKNKSDLIKNVVKKVEEYFKMLKDYKNSPVNSFSFPGSIEIAYVNEEKKQLKIQRQAVNNSVFSHLFKRPTILLYGNKYANRTSEGVSQSEDFRKMEVSMEIPILSFINVCGEAKFRLDNYNRIQYLQGVIKNNDKL